jgi:KRAB domain-containing zinc finger protein
MVALNCPLCCNETFATSSSLKCHILEILDNLICPTCQEKFEKLSELAEHLENDCVETLICSGNDVEEVATKNEEVEDDVSQGGSILAKALLAESQPEKDESESEYFCQMCGVDFGDIDEHLNSYHEGQEIILEEESVESAQSPVEEHTIFIINSTDEQDDGTSPKELVFNSNVPKKLNTITQQDFKDKEGRLYTRKFVKIDKFWLQEDPIKPVTQKYLIGDNGVKKLGPDEATHILDKNSIIEIKKCLNCNQFFAAGDAYETHVCQDNLQPDPSPKKSSSAPYNCEICNTTFPTFKSLRLHRRMHEPIKTREIEAPANYDEGQEHVRHMFICKICNKTYDKEYELVHMNSHNSNNGFNCDVCNRKFFTQTNLDMHMKAHSNNKKFTCSYCKKPFVTYDALNEHLSNQCQKRPYACQFCGRRFARPHEKVKHERIHTGEKPHVCDICGKAFRVSYCLTLHLRTHSGTRPYQCKHCGKRFKSHSVYNHHLLTHSDVRAYKCPYCPKAFKTSVQLAGHKNSHIKPFTCTDCNRPFSSLYAVRAHMETHKRDNNLKYECWICGALYSRAFALRDHLKQQHQQVEGEKAKAEVVGVDEEMEAANSILVSEDIILGLDGATNIEIIENEAE